MAFAAEGPFTHPDPVEDETYPNAYFRITAVDHRPDEKPYAGKDSLGSYSVWKTQAARSNGKRPRYKGTFPFDYVVANGGIRAQALAALKALPEYPGLIDA